MRHENVRSAQELFVDSLNPVGARTIEANQFDASRAIKRLIRNDIIAVRKYPSLRSPPKKGEAELGKVGHPFVERLQFLEHPIRGDWIAGRDIGESRDFIS